jgi:hypothetical protein
VRLGASYHKIFLIIDLGGSYRVIRSLTGISAKLCNWHITSLCLVSIFSPGRWSKLSGDVVGGSELMMVRSLKTRTLVGRLVGLSLNHSVRVLL